MTAVVASAIVQVLRGLEADLESERAAELSGAERAVGGAAAALDALLDGDFEVVTPAAAMDVLAAAGTVVVGDFHALPESKLVLARILEEMARRGRAPVVALDAMRAGRGTSPASGLSDWAFGSEPWAAVLATARILGLDLTGIRGRRDRTQSQVERHGRWSRRLFRAAGASRQRFVVVGEMHAVPSSLPRILAQGGHPGPVVSLFLCPPRFFWRLLDAGIERPEGVAVILQGGAAMALCPVHPLRRAASFGAWLEGEPEVAVSPPETWNPSLVTIDPAPLATALSTVARALGTTPAAVGEVMVTGPGDVAALESLLGSLPPAAAVEFLAHVRACRSWYHPNPPVAIYLARLATSHVGEELAHAVHAVLSPGAPRDPEDVFWEHVVREAVAFAASPVLAPGRRPPSVAHLRRVAASDGEPAVVATTLLSFLTLCRRGARRGAAPRVPEADPAILGALAHGVGYGLAPVLLASRSSGVPRLLEVARAPLDAPGGAAELVMRLMRDGQVG
jgi:hypothetical protein